LFLLNPHGFEIQSPKVDPIRESFVYTSETGIGIDGFPFVLFRAHNESLRRDFRELLRWGNWDALIIDGLVSAAPLMGDRGLELPRGLSWLVYREREEDPAKIYAEKKWYQPKHWINQWRLAKWRKNLKEKSAEVVQENRPQLRAAVLNHETNVS
jgi:hypothetical protein